MSSCSWQQFGVLLCWQTWASFGYRAGSAATWRGNGSIPGRYPPPGVSQRPSYAVHRSYVVVICTSSSFGPLFIVVRCSYVVVHRSSSFVRRRHSYVIRMSLFVCHCRLVLCTLSYIVHCPLYVVVCCSYVVVRCSYVIVRLLSLYVVVHRSSSFVRCPCGNVPRNIVENSLLVKDKKDERYKKTRLGPKRLLSSFGPAFLPVD
jgi:hypothetical protein